MEDWELPAELQQLERDLGNCSLGDASTRLRQRVLDDVRSRLLAERSRSRWQFAAAVAAVAMVWMNLSMSATQATDFGFRRSGPTESVKTIAQQMQRVMPEFFPKGDCRKGIE